MKIDIKKPKYALPLILFPFFFLFFYIYESTAKGSKGSKAVRTEEAKVKEGEINANLPGVSSRVANQALSDKFKSYQKHWKNMRNTSAINPIEPPRGDADQNPYSSPFGIGNEEQTAAGQRLDSLRQMINQQKRAMESNHSEAPVIYSNQNETPDELLQQIEEARKKYQARNETEDRYNNSSASGSKDELSEFREKMKIVDSMNKAQTEAYFNRQDSKTTNKPPKKGNDFDPSQDSTFKPLPVSLTRSNVDNFNTIRPFKAQKSIRAIIDENEKVYAQSRVRIRLLTDIYVGENRIPKGSYLYAMVSGFQMHRVNLSITQIMYEDRPLPVNLDIYDQDGYLGLHVPKSNFREFSKQIGTSGTQGLSQIQLVNEGNMKQSLIRQLFQTTGSSMGNYIRKDKAFVKYNYIVYLMPNKSKN